MKHTLLIFELLLITLPAFAQNAGDAFEKANDLYSEKKYEQAAVIYKDLADKGYKDADLYYNLGNAYYKMDMIPQAILYYEKAKELAPEDEDINLNLRMAYLQTVDKIEAVPKVFYIEWYESLIEEYHSSFFAWLMVAFVWIMLGSLAGFLKFRSPGVKKALFAVAGVSLVAVILSLTLSIRSYNEEASNDEGIIFSTSVYVKSSPDESGTNLFILHEGTKVQLLEEVDNWKKIKIASGDVGWVPPGTLEMI